MITQKLTQEQLQQSTRAYQYDPALVDFDTRQELIDGGYIVVQKVARRLTTDAADLTYFYTSEPSL